MIRQASFIEKQINIKSIFKFFALISIAVYIILTVIFESLASDSSRWASLGMYACLVLCAAYVLVKRQVRFNWILWLLLIFGAILSVSALYTEADPSTVDMYLSMYWKTVVLLFFVINTVEERRDFDFLINTFIVAGVFLALYMYGFYGLEYLFSASERLDDEMGNQNNVAIRCTFAVIFAIYRTVTSKSLWRWLWVIMMVVCVPAIMFLASRKAILMIVGSLFVFFIVYDKDPKTQIKNFIKKIFLIAVVFAVAIYLIYNVPAFEVIKVRFDEMFSFISGEARNVNEGDVNRERYVVEGLKAFLESPIWGNGFYYSEYLLGTYTHNNYIELLLNNGIIGFIAFYYIYVKLFLGALKVKKRSIDMYALFMTLITALLIMDIGVVSYFSRYSLLMMTICVCAIESNLHIASENNK